MEMPGRGSIFCRYVNRLGSRYLIGHKRCRKQLVGGFCDIRQGLYTIRIQSCVGAKTVSRSGYICHRYMNSLRWGMLQNEEAARMRCYIDKGSVLARSSCMCAYPA